MPLALEFTVPCFSRRAEGAKSMGSSAPPRLGVEKLQPQSRLTQRTESASVFSACSVVRQSNMPCHVATGNPTARIKAKALLCVTAPGFMR